MATNAEEDDTSKQDEIVNENDEETTDVDTTDEDTSEDSDSTDDGQTDDDAEKGESQDDTSTFTKGEGFDWLKGGTVEEAFESLKQAYSNSSAEALKWKRKAEGKDVPPEKQSGKEEMSPILRQAERRELESMNKEYDNFLERYPSANEPGNDDKLKKRVQSISKAIQEDEDREPSFAEVLGLAASSLGWKEDKSGKIAEAMKDAAASSTRSSTPKPTSKSKVTPAQIKAAKRFGWADGLSDAEIAKELEAYAV